MRTSKRNVARKDKANTVGPLVRNGERVKVVIELEGEVVTELDSVTPEQLEEMVRNDRSFNIPQVSAGSILPDSEKDGDTEILFETHMVSVIPNVGISNGANSK